MNITHVFLIIIGLGILGVFLHFFNGLILHWRNKENKKIIWIYFLFSGISLILFLLFAQLKGDISFIALPFGAASFLSLLAGVFNYLKSMMDADLQEKIK